MSPRGSVPVNPLLRAFLGSGWATQVLPVPQKYAEAHARRSTTVKELRVLLEAELGRRVSMLLEAASRSGEHTSGPFFQASVIREMAGA